MSDARESHSLEVLVFEVGGRHYGVPSSQVQEITQAVASMPVPEASPLVEGVINLRGDVVPVVDPRHRLQLPAKDPEPGDHLVIGWAGSRRIALRVDRALELARLDAGAVERARELLPSAEFAPDIAKLPEGLLLVHDFGSFLSTTHAAALDGLLPRSSSPGDEE